MNEQNSYGDRVPPQAIEAEESVLGAMMLHKEAVGKAIEILDETCFYKDSHKKIYVCMMELFNEGQPIDQISVIERLKRKKHLEDVGGAYFVTGLVERVPSAANIEYHAKIVLEKSILRKLINISTNLIAESYDAKEDVYDLLDRAEQRIFNLSESRLRGGFTPIDPILHSTFEAIESFHQKRGGVTGIPSGFAQLDAITSGFQRSDFVIIAGRPSMGKTALALSMARNAAVDYKIPAGIFSLEMASYQLALRLLCAEARVDSHLVRTGRLPADMWQNLSLCVGKLAEAPIYIDDSPALGLMEIRAKARRLKAEYDVGVIFLDYLQLIRGPKGADSRQQEISEISRSLKALAKEINIPIVALSQLSRAVEVRGGDKRPVLSDLRESGAIEQDADLVIFIYRPERYGKTVDEKGNSLEGVAEIIIGKQRNGPTGKLNLVFIEKYARFESLSPYEETGYGIPF